MACLRDSDVQSAFSESPPDVSTTNGRTPERDSLSLVIRQVHEELALPLADMALAQPAREAHPEWSPAELSRFRRELTEAIADTRTALAAYERFLREELLPVARPPERAGTLFLPDGAACYAALIHRETSLPLSAEAIHATGLAELERIHAELRALGRTRFGTDAGAT